MRIKWCYIIHEGEKKRYFARRLRPLSLERTFTLLDEFGPECLMTPDAAKYEMEQLKDERYRLKTIFLRTK
jgi:hypothetical protein